MCRGGNVILNSVCLLYKIYADVTGTSVLSFGGFFVSLSLFVCKWLPGNRVIALDHQLLPAIPQGIN